ncbi:MAG: hypothetical protein JXQ73_11205 [Phycisphaerae bacterium]|nr:hypothetical protein [Phycisphaerae bacterium]
MSRLLEWLLDLQSIRFGDGAHLALRWQSAWPAWLTALAVALVIVWVWAIYRKENGAGWGRAIGGVLRVALLVLALALLFRPMLLLQRTRIEPSEVALLVDDSASMGAADTYADAAATTRPVGPTSATTQTGPSRETPQRSRLDLIRAALSARQNAALAALAQRNGLTVYAFADRARRQAGPVKSDALEPVARSLAGLQPKGLETNVPGAIRQVLSEPRSGRLAAIVVASDGRNTGAADVEGAVKAASELQVPVHAIMLGSERPRRDVALESAVADETVFVRDLIAVRARISATGLDGATPLTVKLLAENDAVLSQERLTLSGTDAATDVEIRYRPPRPGKLRLRVRVEPIEGESNVKNNVELVEVQVLDEKVKVLYVDGYPRYECRYLQNMLIREETVTTSCLLLSADEGFAQQGNEPIKRFPETMEELAPYDVVIFGDVNPRGDWLSPTQMTTLIDWVGDRGGGFLLVAGPRWSPQAFLGTPLEKLIPVRINAGAPSLWGAALTSPFRLQLTLEGRRSPIFRFETDAKENERTASELPGMFWYAQTLGPAPGVEILAEHPTARTVDGAMPLLVIGRYGVGATAFAGYEETWRWRRDIGGRLFDVYWLQLIRRLTRSQMLGQDRRFVLQTDRPRYDLGQSVVLTLDVLDKAESAALPETLPAEVTDAEGRLVARLSLKRLGQSASTYEATLVPSRPGSLSVRLDPSLMRPGQKPPTAVIRLESDQPELRRLDPDHTALRQLAAATGGLAVGPDGIERIAARIENRSAEIPDDVSEPLWDTKLVLAIFVLIIGTEWILRKAIGLV